MGGRVLEAVLIGGGNRGRFTYGDYARRRPDRLRIVALAEPDAARRAALAREHALPPDAVHADWRPLLQGGRRAVAAIVATDDMLHVEPTLAALACGYNVLLEKPIAPAASDCVGVVEAAERHGRMLQIAHVLRYTAFYTQVKAVIDSGRLGRLVALDMKEHVSTWHMTHSYVRGKFRNRAVAAPIVLAKCCHDLDLIAWFAGVPARRLASFGSLAHYRPEGAPAGAPERCSDGCPVQSDCSHDAVRFYADPPEEVAGLWPWSDVSPDPARAARLEALRRGPYGRCVYRCDNDVPDHQIVGIEFEDGLTASFTLHGHATHERRTLRISGTRGEMRGVFQDGVLEVTRHGSLETERIEVGGDALGHYGGDEGLLDHFTEVAHGDSLEDAQSSGRIALESHLLGFAAESARQRGVVVDMARFRASAS